MTHQEKLQLRGLWAMYAAYYRQQLPDEVFVMYADDLADLAFEPVKAALEAYRRNPKNRSLPIPADIRATLEPQIDPDSAAREIAARITAAIPKFGWCNGAEARVYIGEVGWQVVCDQGGWTHICQHHGLELNPSSFQAQVRDLARSRLTHDQNSMAKVIGIGQRQSAMGLQSANELISCLLPERPGGT